VADHQLGSIKSYTQDNRKAWNDAVPKHQAARAGHWDTFFAKPGAVLQQEPELAKLQPLVEGKCIAQLCCSNGIELLSLINLGAKEVVGFDISDENIKEAEGRSRKLNFNVEYHCCDVYEIPAKYDSRFDLIYLTVGALGWLPDLNLFFAKVATLLKPGGSVFIYEMHPMTDILNDDRNPDVHPLQVTQPYFSSKPYTNFDSLDYIGRTRDSGLKKHWFTHTLTSLFSSLIGNDISIVQFEEFEHDISKVFPLLESQNAGIPLSYILIGKKGFQR
jgi:SAM-dependent methyltransferase